MLEKRTRETPGEERKNARALCAALVHRVGKYASRVARNLPPGKVPAELKAMLTKDLFATDGQQPASRLFARLAEPLEQLVRDERLDRCRAALGEIDQLEQEIRRGTEAAVRRGAELALEVDALLRETARRLSEED